MAEPLSQLLAQARSRWMIGGEPTGADHPLTLGQPAAEADLRLLAVAGQYQRIRLAPNAPPLNLKSDLPKLSLPLLPEALRPVARRLLADKSEQAPIWLAIFAARRGYALHPADWMPPSGADLPEVYRPLQLWQVDRAEETDALTTETWLDHPRADRLDRFKRLLASDPAAARALLTEHLAASPADERLSLVEALGQGLSDADAGFLESLSGDRSEKVRKAAQHLLARLGRVGADPLAAEAAAMFELATEGLIRRRKVLRLDPKAKEGQLRSLAQNLPELTLQGLAQVLGLTAAEFVEHWQPEKVGLPVQAALSELIRRTATEADLATYWQRLREHSGFARTCLPTLYPRLSAPDQQATALWLIEGSGLSACPEVLALMGAAVPAQVSAALTARRKELADLVRLARDTTPEKAASARADAQRLANCLSFLGLMVTTEDAVLIVQTLTAAGLHPVDPMLDRLNFNAALKGP
jgi:hypothetical protein